MLKKVEITPTAHSKRDGFDLSITKQHANASWGVSDLTLIELEQIESVIHHFLAEAAKSG